MKFAITYERILLLKNECTIKTSAKLLCYDERIRHVAYILFVMMLGTIIFHSLNIISVTYIYDFFFLMLIRTHPNKSIDQEPGYRYRIQV